MFYEKLVSIVVIIALAAIIGTITSHQAFTSTSLYIDEHPQHARACERAKAKMQNPTFNTWKNRLTIWSCFREKN
jgi:hypothetical protein